jgi:hypothetical protein
MKPQTHAPVQRADLLGEPAAVAGRCPLAKEIVMDKQHDQTAKQSSSQPRPQGKALQVNENSIEDGGPVRASPPTPRKPREQREEKQQGEAIRVNDNTV